MLNAPQSIDRLWPRGTDCPFDEVLDVRSPGEFAEDHMLDAINLPVLSDGERERVGTLYRASPFEARKLGAGLIAANISRLLETHFAGKGKDYRPFVYCFRGGLRSASLAAVLAPIGWRVTVLAGGYRTYRAHVLHELEALPATMDLCVLSGATGSGKTRLLYLMARHGAQVIDLEGLANHRGSLLGHLGPQPPQKLFESHLLASMDPLDFHQPVWIEAESNRVGDRVIPAALWRRMRSAAVVELRIPIAERAAALWRGYQHLAQSPGRLKELLRRLNAHQGRERLAQWDALIDAGDWSGLVASLLKEHYDPAYAHSARKCFAAPSQVVDLPDAADATLDRCARDLLR